MGTLTLRNIPDQLLERLRALATAERRSLNQQAIRLLEDALAERPSFGDALARFLTVEESADDEVADLLDAVRSREPGREVSL